MRTFYPNECIFKVFCNIVTVEKFKQNSKQKFSGSVHTQLMYIWIWAGPTFMGFLVLVCTAQPGIHQLQYGQV